MSPGGAGGDVEGGGWRDGLRFRNGVEPVLK